MIAKYSELAMGINSVIIDVVVEWGVDLFPMCHTQLMTTIISMHCTKVGQFTVLQI